MSDTFKFVAGKKYKLAGSGCTLSDTSITLQSFVTPGGALLTMTDFGGVVGYGTLEPKTSKVELISFSGVTQNVDGTATLTGVTRGLNFVAPYTADNSLRQAHSGGVTFIVSNTPQFYDRLTGKDNDETINGQYTFIQATRPVLSTDEHATDRKQLVTQGELLDTAFSGVNIDSVVITGTAGETLVALDLVYFKESDQRWWKTDADAFATASNNKLAIVKTGGVAGGGITLYLSGYVTGFSGLTAGGKLYVSGTAGALSQSLTTIPRFVGWALNTTSIMFSPDDLDTNIVPSISGEALAVGNFVYLKESDQKWYKTDADAAATAVGVQIGIAQTLTSAIDQLVLIRVKGVDTTQTGLTPGGRYYLSGTSGAITTTPGTFARFVGVALNAQQFLFGSDSNPFATHQNGQENYAASATGTDAYAITLAPAPLAYVTGAVYNVKADVANTAAATLNVNGLGVKNIRKWGTGGKLALSAGDIQASQFVQFIYDGTVMLLLSSQQPRPLFNQGSVTYTTTGTKTIAHGLGVTPRLILFHFANHSGGFSSDQFGTGSAVSAAQQSCAYVYTGGATHGVGSNASSIIEGRESNAGSVVTTGTITALDATNITLDMSAISGTLELTWEAFA